MQSPPQKRGFFIATQLIIARLGVGANLKMLKAIECKYAGRRFRSRREARWAILFDHLEIDWRYEPDAYDLGSNTCYLPDFELHLPGGQRQWVEVKPDLLRYPQLSMLCEQSKQVGFVVAEPMLRASVLPCDQRGRFKAPLSTTAWLMEISDRDGMSCQAASNAALSARWGHGEQPTRPRKAGGRGPRAYTRADALINQSSDPSSGWGLSW